MMNNISKNLWILTEEKPKTNIIGEISVKFFNDRKWGFLINSIQIIPLFENEKFIFTYEVIGIRCNRVNKIYIKIISGTSSFVDFLVYYKNNIPNQNDEPIYAIEETKTDDSESRNTGVYQRASKFVYIDFYYPNTKKIMLYNLRIAQKKQATDTNVFGSKMLSLLGVEIMGKLVPDYLKQPFKSIDELVSYKNRMRRPPRGNVPITITKNTDSIVITGRLFKSDSLSHDPNIGALSLIAASLRKLNWDKDIIIQNHGLTQRHITTRNKFIKIANLLNIKLGGLTVPTTIKINDYWKYDTKREKNGTIFLHIAIEEFTEGYSIFDNHGGCEKGYFIKSDGTPVAISKYTDRSIYKAGNKNKIIHLPDLIIVDKNENEIINIEGKTFDNMEQGIKELKSYDAIESILINKYYPSFMIIRSLVLFGFGFEELLKIEVGFFLHSNGSLILGKNPPQIFKDAINNLHDFWN